MQSPHASNSPLKSQELIHHHQEQSSWPKSGWARKSGTGKLYPSFTASARQHSINGKAEDEVIRPREFGEQHTAHEEFSALVVGDGEKREEKK